jgi:hypothetical protein
MIRRGGRYLKPSLSGRYPIVTLSKEGRIRYFTVHSLIALAFLGPRPEGGVVNHIDGNKLNNRPDNLEYCTPKENAEHAAYLGLTNNKGSTNPNYKHGKSKDKDYVNSQWNKRYFTKQYETHNV